MARKESHPRVWPFRGPKGKKLMVRDIDKLVRDYRCAAGEIYNLFCQIDEDVKSYGFEGWLYLQNEFSHLYTAMVDAHTKLAYLRASASYPIYIDHAASIPFEFHHLVLTSFYRHGRAVELNERLASMLHRMSLYYLKNYAPRGDVHSGEYDWLESSAFLNQTTEQGDFPSAADVHTELTRKRKHLQVIDGKLPMFKV